MNKSLGLPVTKLFLVGALGVLAPRVAAQTLVHVRVDAADAVELAAAMERAGRDLVEGSVTRDSFELVVTRTELRELTTDGLAPVVLAEGRPFLEIQAERAVEGAPPPGYPTLAQIHAQMNAAAASFPAICEVVNLTQRYGTPPTFEGRDMFAVKISDNVGIDEDEPNVLAVSAHHCRELVTPVIGLRAIELLTTGYLNDPVITAMVNGLEIWIAPIWNPDGYEYVFTTDNLWRKNRRVFLGAVGVDQNRNYPFGWSSACAGSTNMTSPTYKGPTPASEPETQTMLALHHDRSFALIADFHSSGEYLIHGYNCASHPFASFLQTEAGVYSTASGFGGATSSPSAHGEHYQTPLAFLGTLAFLWETEQQFQPSYAAARLEADQVWPGLRDLFRRRIPLSGHVTDANTGLPLVADIRLPSAGFSNGEQGRSNARFGRYHVFLPAGSHDVEFSAPGYVTQLHPVTVGGLPSQVLNVALDPTTVTYCSGKTSSLGCVPFLTFAGVPSATDSAPFQVRANDVVPSELGFFLYGLNGRSNLSFHGGKLCVKAPLTRWLPAKVTKASGSPPCTGTQARNFNNRIQSGADPALVPGQRVTAQFRQRDPALGDGFDDGLTDGIDFTIVP